MTTFLISYDYMKPKANINLSQWVYAVWAAASISIFSAVLDIMEVEWSSYVSLPGTILEAVIWGFIVMSLYKSENIKPILILLIIGALSVDIISDILSLISDENLMWMISMGLWVIALIVIIVSYSGLFRKYAIIELACMVGLFALGVAMELFDFQSQKTVFHAVMKYAVVPLLYFPYQALTEALCEGEEEDEEEEVEGEPE